MFKYLDGRIEVAGRYMSDRTSSRAATAKAATAVLAQAVYVDSSTNMEKLAALHSGKGLIAFDLDNTMVPAGTTMTEETARAMAELLKYRKVAIVSGAGFSEIDRRVVDVLKGVLAEMDQAELMANLILLPSVGSSLYTYSNGGYAAVYSENLKEAEKSHIRAVFTALLDEGAFGRQAQVYGDQIVDKGSSMTLVITGNDAPPDVKNSCDPNKALRRSLLPRVRGEIGAGFNVTLGGPESIDVTRSGVDKGYGVEKLITTLGIRNGDVVYIGDAFASDGNDYPVLRTGVDALHVKSPTETWKFVLAVVRNASINAQLLRKSSSDQA